MKIVVQSLLSRYPGMGSNRRAAEPGILTWPAVIATQLFAGAFPEWSLPFWGPACKPFFR